MVINVIVKRIAEVPTVPSFIRVDGCVIPIAEFSDEELKQVGEEWTRRLLDKARRNRRTII